MKHRDFNQQGTGWSFRCQVEDDDPFQAVDGGLILNKITEHGHRFADEIRVIGFWVEWEEMENGIPIGETVTNSKVLKKKFFLLSSENFDVGRIEELYPKAIGSNKIATEWKQFKESRSMLGFGHFPFYFGIRVKYKPKPNIFDGIDNFDKIGIEISQTILFSKYSNMPVHEPTGGLWAARIHPLISIKWIDNPDFHRNVPISRRLVAIRFDYLFHMNLDRHYVLNENGNFPDLGNQVGIFKDEEGADFLGYFANPYGDRLRGAHGVVFGGAEKPLLMEIVAKGLADGFPIVKYKGKDVMGWDNIHFWGARGGGRYPSTPGAFHAAHMHWRWGLGVKGAPYGTERQFIDGGFRDIAKKNQLDLLGELGMGVALVDPNCWIQTIEFAITRNDYNLYMGEYILAEELRKLSLSQFYQKFYKIGGKEPRLLSPNPREKGSDLTTWVSIRISRDRDSVRARKDSDENIKIFKVKESCTMNGSIFVHGIFFGHEAEPQWYEPVMGSLLPNVALGSTNEIYWPRRRQEIMNDDPRQWERY